MSENSLSLTGDKSLSHRRKRGRSCNMKLPLNYFYWKYHEKLPLKVTILNNLYLFPCCISSIKLFSFCFALHNRINCFQVRRVSHQGQSDFLVCFSVDPFMVHSQVVFYIPRSLTRKMQSQFRNVIPASSDSLGLKLVLQPEKCIWLPEH